MALANSGDGRLGFVKRLQQKHCELTVGLKLQSHALSDKIRALPGVSPVRKTYIKFEEYSIISVIITSNQTDRGPQPGQSCTDHAQEIVEN